MCEYISITSCNKLCLNKPTYRYIAHINLSITVEKKCLGTVLSSAVAYIVCMCVCMFAFGSFRLQPHLSTQILILNRRLKTQSQSILLTLCSKRLCLTLIYIHLLQTGVKKGSLSMVKICLSDCTVLDSRALNLWHTIPYVNM